MVQEVWLMRNVQNITQPKIEKQHQKLIRLNRKAEKCMSRKEAQKIIKKAAKAYNKLSHAHERIS